MNDNNDNIEIALARIERAAHLRSRELDLSGLKLTIIPSEVFALTHLRELNMNRNLIKELPVDIEKFYDLRMLGIASNKIKSLPKEIGSLDRLEVLWVGSNNISELPDSCAQLGALRSLGIFNNNFDKMPDLSSLCGLEELYCSNNRIRDIPGWMGALERLTCLDVSTNDIAELPQDLLKLKNLKELLVGGNPRLALPSEITGETSVVDYDAVLNTMNRVAAASILGYYFRTRGGARPLNEAKLILVGRGAVGKTTLVRRLMTGKFSKPKKTEGIQIKEWPLSLRRNDKIQLNVWDFGGQEIMHSTHQFFLTERSLYLLVVTGREGREDEDAEYWLKLIHSFGGDSPVVVVLNKQNEHPFELNRGALQQKYPNIKRFIPTDCETGLGMADLRAKIKEQADGLEGLRKQFPAEWFQIKKRLSGMKENFLTFQDYRKICLELDEKDEQAQDDLAEYLHVLGVALNYCDDPRLSHMHVLNPQWVVDGIYRIINAKQLAERHGELHQSDLGKILPKEDYPRDMHGYLLGLMRKFELCFPLPEDGRYLVPDLLAKEQAAEAAEFDPKHCLNFQYDYGSMPIPEGLLPRFIVRSHTLSRGLPRWRTGVILDFEGASALVRADKAEKKVYISIRGHEGARLRLLSVIRSDFDRIHGDLKGLEPRELVPIPGHPEVHVPYSDLIAAEAKKVEKWPVTVAGEVEFLDVRTLRMTVDAGKPDEDAVSVFVSYAHEDEGHKDQLTTHLKILERKGLIRSWQDRQIPAGGKWDEEIKRRLETADIAVMVVSSDFLASDYIWDVELPRALELDSVTVVPVIARRCDWAETKLKHLNALPPDGRPLSDWAAPDDYWYAVEQGIKEEAQRIRSARNR